MSRLFPESLLVRLAPALSAEPWQDALARLRETDFRNARVTVELSNHYVRYALVPWSDALSTLAEEEIYARHHFAKIHGERAKSWAIRTSGAPHGEARLASAVDVALIDNLRQVFEKTTARLISVQPALMSRFNAARKAVPNDGAWFVVAELERSCVALHDGKTWRAVQNAKGDWRATLERERHRVETAVPSLVLLTGTDAPANDAYFRFKKLNP